MCESNAYTLDGALIMEDVISIKVDGEKVYITDVLNQKKELDGTIVEIDLEKHRIYIEKKPF